MTLWLMVAGAVLRFDGPAPIAVVTHGVSVVVDRGSPGSQRLYVHIESTSSRVEWAHLYIVDDIEPSLRGQRMSITGTFETVALGPQGVRNYWLCVPGPRDTRTLYSSWRCVAKPEPWTYWLTALPVQPGDLNGDGRIDGADAAYVLSAWDTDDAIADIDGSGCVDGADLSLLLGGWTQ